MMTYFVILSAAKNPSNLAVAKTLLKSQAFYRRYVQGMLRGTSA